MKVCPYNLNSLYVSAVTKVLEPVKDQVHQELAQKLTATDSLLKDNIGKMVRSKVCHVWLHLGEKKKKHQTGIRNFSLRKH